MMNYSILQNAGRFLWTIQDLAAALSITEPSARVLASRYSQRNLLTRLKRNLYGLTFQLPQLRPEDRFYLSNLIQTPSYVSLMTALSFYGITTQITRDVIEAVSPVRTAEFEAGPLAFRYTKLNFDLYEGFERKGLFFIATPEKALLDAVYLMSLGRYSMDLSSLDLNRLSLTTLRSLARRFPKRTQTLIQKLWKN